jgi:hypothetical protein
LSGKREVAGATGAEMSGAAGRSSVFKECASDALRMRRNRAQGPGRAWPGLAWPRRGDGGTDGGRAPGAGQVGSTGLGGR